MSTTSLPARLAMTAFTVIFLITGCKKEQSSSGLSPQEEEQAAIHSSQSESDAQSVFTDVLESSIGANNELATAGLGIYGRVTNHDHVARMDSVSRCFTVTVTPQQINVFPKTVIQDFGTGCLVHGRLRAGKIITVYTGRLGEPGKSATTTFENYKIDSLSIEGTHKVTNTTAPGSHQRQLKIEISNARLASPNGDYREWNATRIHTQIEGNATHSPADDVFHITGHSDGKIKRRTHLTSWVSEIKEPLIKPFACRWITKGLIKTVRTGLPSGSQWAGLLDYGDGTCDNKATLTINGNVHQIVLR